MDRGSAGSIRVHRWGLPSATHEPQCSPASQFRSSEHVSPICRAELDRIDSQNPHNRRGAHETNGILYKNFKIRRRRRRRDLGRGDSGDEDEASRCCQQRNRGSSLRAQGDLESLWEVQRERISDAPSSPPQLRPSPTPISEDVERRSFQSATVETFNKLYGSRN